MKILVEPKTYTNEMVKELDKGFMTSIGYTVIKEEYLEEENLIRVVYEKE